MGFGIGAGAFVSGLKSGIGLKRDQETFDMAKEDRQRRIQQQEEDRSFELQQRDRALEEQERIDKQREDRRSVVEQGRATFDEKVASGEMTDADFDKFWNDYTIPRLRNVMLEQNDYEGAKALDEWAESADAKRGAKLVGSSLLKAQTGDHEGALKDVIEVSKINGYLNSDFEIVDAEPVENGAGQVLGYRLQIQSGDEVIEQDIALDDIPQVISTFANPAAAFKSQMEANATQAQKEAEMREFEQKEQIKAGVKKPSDDAKLRTDAIKSILEESKDSLDAEDQPNFYDLPREQQEQMINNRISVMTGEQPMVVPEPQILVDTQAAQVVPVGIARPEQPSAPDVLPERGDSYDGYDPDNPLDLPVPWQKPLPKR